MIENGFFKVCKLSALKENEGKRFLIDDVDIAVFLVKGTVYALSNVCPHQHASVIHDGFIEDGCVVCPAHGWMFRLETGNLIEGRRGIDSFEVKIIDDYVYAKVFKRELKW